MRGIILRELYDPNYSVDSPLSREEQLNVCFTTRRRLCNTRSYFVIFV